MNDNQAILQSEGNSELKNKILKKVETLKKKIEEEKSNLKLLENKRNIEELNGKISKIIDNLKKYIKNKYLKIKEQLVYYQQLNLKKIDIYDNIKKCLEYQSKVKELFVEFKELKKESELKIFDLQKRIEKIYDKKNKIKTEVLSHINNEFQNFLNLIQGIINDNELIDNLKKLNIKFNKKIYYFYPPYLTIININIELNKYNNLIWDNINILGKWEMYHLDKNYRPIYILKNNNFKLGKIKDNSIPEELNNYLETNNPKQNLYLFYITIFPGYKNINYIESNIPITSYGNKWYISPFLNLEDIIYSRSHTLNKQFKLDIFHSSILRSFYSFFSISNMLNYMTLLKNETTSLLKDIDIAEERNEIWQGDKKWSLTNKSHKSFTLDNNWISVSNELWNQIKSKSWWTNLDNLGEIKFKTGGKDLTAIVGNYSNPLFLLKQIRFIQLYNIKLDNIEISSYDSLRSYHTGRWRNKKVQLKKVKRLVSDIEININTNIPVPKTIKLNHIKNYTTNEIVGELNDFIGVYTLESNHNYYNVFKDEDYFIPILGIDGYVEEDDYFRIFDLINNDDNTFSIIIEMNDEDYRNIMLKGKTNEIFISISEEDQFSKLCLKLTTKNFKKITFNNKYKIIYDGKYNELGLKKGDILSYDLTILKEIHILSSYYEKQDIYVKGNKFLFKVNKTINSGNPFWENIKIQEFSTFLDSVIKNYFILGAPLFIADYCVPFVHSFIADGGKKFAKVFGYSLTNAVQPTSLVPPTPNSVATAANTLINLPTNTVAGFTFSQLLVPFLINKSIQKVNSKLKAKFNFDLFGYIPNLYKMYARNRYENYHQIKIPCEKDEWYLCEWKQDSKYGEYTSVLKLSGINKSNNFVNVIYDNLKNYKLKNNNNYTIGKIDSGDNLEVSDKLYNQIKKNDIILFNANNLDFLTKISK